MVLLTMTPCIVEALNFLNKDSQTNYEKQSQSPIHKTWDHDNIPQVDGSKESEKFHKPEESEERITNIGKRRLSRDAQQLGLATPKIGNPITHRQVIDLSITMKSLSQNSYRLECLLLGSRVYVPPPPQKPEPSSEYKALMAQLRQREEEQKYSRMINPSYSRDLSFCNYPIGSASNVFSPNYLSISDEDDEMTYSDINRQMALIFNVLISIVACGAAIWTAARWWNTPMRLAASMSGSILVGIAEIVVYAGYIRKLSEAKAKEKAIKETKEVVKSWVLSPDRNDKITESPETIIKTALDVAPEPPIVRRRK